ncbi:MAG: hypothetical protein ABR615_03385 [Pseudonocardiaceae bacterium]
MACPRLPDRGRETARRPAPTRDITLDTQQLDNAEESYRQEQRGRPGANTRYRRRTHTRFTISWDITLDRVAHDTASDGCFPLISNDTTLSDAEVLAAYRYQPTSNAATTCSSPCTTPRRCCCTTPPGSKRCSAASSSRCSSAP